jgi:hypothetical protein
MLSEQAPKNNAPNKTPKDNNVIDVRMRTSD